MKTIFLSIVFLSQIVISQNIGDFTSITPAAQSDQFIIPSSHKFQKLAESGDILTVGGTALIETPDFSGYVPIAGSSTNGYLSLNHERPPGAVTVFDVNLNGTTKLWNVSASEAVDFSISGLTFANCSGTVTPWNTIITCEELSTSLDFFAPNNGYGDSGWNIEIDPATKSVINNGKLWAMGNFKHENVTIHTNHRTVYQGADDIDDFGFLYKFVATNAQDLTQGDLYVYVGSKSGTGAWVLINDSTDPMHQLPAHRNNTNILSQNAGAEIFEGIEDVEIGPDGWVYFAVKNNPDARVYRFQDTDPLESTASVVTMETYAGGPGVSYDINDGTNTTSVSWGTGNDNLAFDGDGNLWVLQDGNNNYIWVVKNGHTQVSPDVEIFGITPNGAEPTGITFTPDYKYLFMSIQHPSSSNLANQMDAAGNTINFNKGTTLVIALSENLGTTLTIEDESFNSPFKAYPNPLRSSKELMIKGKDIHNITLYSILGELILDLKYKGLEEIELNLNDVQSGLYILKVNGQQTSKLIIE